MNLSQYWENQGRFPGSRDAQVKKLKEKKKEETEGWKGVNQVKRGKVLYARGRVYAEAQKSEGLMTFWGAESWAQLEYEE